MWKLCAECASASFCGPAEFMILLLEEEVVLRNQATTQASVDLLLETKHSQPQSNFDPQAKYG